MHKLIIRWKDRSTPFRVTGSLLIRKFEDGTGFQCGLFECSDVGYYGE